MRVCYFIQAHNYPEQVYRLVKTIKRGSPDAIVIIGYDFTHSSISMEPLQHLSDVYLLAGNFPIRRGEFSMLQPYLNAVDWLLKNEIEFDWLAYLSGQDYPIKSLEEIENYLAETQYDGFLQYYNVLSEQSPWSIEQAKKRYFYQYFLTLSIPKVGFNRKLLYKLVHLIQDIQSILSQLQLQFILPINLLFTCANTLKIGTFAFNLPFNKKFICYGGNHRHFLSRKCIFYLQKYSIKKPKLIKFYQKTEISDESFVQTILVNSGQFNFYNHHKIYDVYQIDDAYGHPKSLTLEDYPKLIQSSCFFARKFEPNSPLLDQLDAHVLAPVNS